MSAYLTRAARDGAAEVFSTRTPWWYQKWGQILPTHALQLKVQRAWRNATARDAGLAMSMRFAKAPDGKGYEPVPSKKISFMSKRHISAAAARRRRTTARMATAAATAAPTRASGASSSTRR